MNVFDEIYANDAWSGGSGPGSFPHNTVVYRTFVQSFFKENAVRSVLDVGCGDWQFSRLMEWTGMDYVGVDFSPRAIALARTHAPPEAQFHCGDIRTMPAIEADLALVKDVFQHLSWASIRQVMQSLARCKEILVTNDIPDQLCADTPYDIQDGQWHPVDIRQPPLNYDATLILSFESQPFHKQILKVSNRDLP